MHMAETLTTSALARWRADPCGFIETHLINPETGKAFVLLDAEREFLKHALTIDTDGRLKYPELIYGAVKKSGKSGFAALFVITVLLLFGGRHAEAYVAANDLEQAQSRVFEMCRRIVEASPLLRQAAKITADRITFPATGATITCLASDYASAAGGHPTIAVFDELWGYGSERARRLYDELVPVPTRKISCRLVVTHAGFEGESELLYQLYQRGLQQPLVGTDLYAGDGLLMFWSHVPIAPWQTESWLASMRRTLRPSQYLRMMENRFVTTESNFVDMAAWDACVQPSLVPSSERLPIWVGVDASVKRDSTALVAVSFDKKSSCVRLVLHRVFTPGVLDPIDFEATVEATLLDWRQRYLVRAVWFDPFQMASTAQRLAKAHVPIEEYPQTVPNLTAATQNLFDLIQSRQLVLYPDAGMRLAVSRAVIVETSRGQRITKDKAGHKIDVIVALSMACLAAVRGQEKYAYDLFHPGLTDDVPAPAAAPPPTPGERDRATLLARYGRPVPGYLTPNPVLEEAFERARADAQRRRHLT
jgi:Terminase large subunit, ATPase domain